MNKIGENKLYIFKDIKGNKWASFYIILDKKVKNANKLFKPPFIYKEKSKSLTADPLNNNTTLGVKIMIEKNENNPPDKTKQRS